MSAGRARRHRFHFMSYKESTKNGDGRQRATWRSLSLKVPIDSAMTEVLGGAAEPEVKHYSETIEMIKQEITNLKGKGHGKTAIFATRGATGVGGSVLPGFKIRIRGMFFVLHKGQDPFLRINFERCRAGRNVI